jgi:hypothetical protein
LDGKTKWLLGGGIALDIAGMALVAFSIPEPDWRLAAGLGLLLAGTWMVSTTLRGPAPVPVTAAETEAARGRWKPEPELRQDPPRRVQLSVTAKVVAMAWLLMLAAGGGYAYLMVFSRNPAPPSRNLLDAEGARANATIHRREVRENASGEPRYTLYYHFTDAQGAAIRSSVTLSKMLFERYEEGDSLEVVYLPGDPLAHYLPALTRPAFAERGFLMALVVLAFLAYLLESRRRRHRRLVRQGTPVAGVVENIRRRGGARAYDVLFQLNGRNGSLRATERNPLRKNGDVVTVLCDRTAEDAEIYQQCLYRAL